MSDIFIGYVALDSNNKPHQPTLGTGWQSRTKPVTVYKTKAMALKQSGKAAKVKMIIEDE